MFLHSKIVMTLCIFILFHTVDTVEFDLYLPMEEVVDGEILGYPSVTGYLENGASIVAGKVGKALYTDGIGPGIMFTGAAIENSPLTQPELSDGTVMFWIKFEGPSSTGICVESTPRGFDVKHYMNKFAINWTSRDKRYKWYFPDKDFHTFYHVALVWTQTGVVAYQNGANVPTQSENEALSETPGPGTLMFGRSSSNAESKRCNCYVDDVKVWYEAKSEEFVMAEYAQGSDF